MKLTYKLGLLGLSLITLACTDLDTNNYDFLTEDQYPENEEQAIRVANPAFSRVQGLADWSGWWFLQEITSDEATAPTRGGDWDDGGKWRALHQHNWGPTTEAVEQLWRFIFEGNGIPNANLAIDLLTPGAETSTEVEMVLAQVKVMRAYMYYLAIDNFGDVPFPRSYVNNPIKNPSRTPRAEVFHTIVQDILDNVDALPDPIPGSKATSINKATAYTLLAKLYLNAEIYTGTPMWVEASDACDKVIEFGYSLENDPATSFLKNNGGSPENIFTVAYDEDNFKGFNLHMRTLHYLSQQTFDMGIAPWNGFALMEDHYNLFSSTDKRRYALLVGEQKTFTGQTIYDDQAGGSALVFTPNIPALNMNANQYNLEEIRMSGVRMAKWEIYAGARDNLSNDFAIFRYADVLLMKAEAMVRLNGIGAGDGYVNQVKSRANIPTPGGYNLEEILAERGRELVWEGHRRQDLIRFGKFNNVWWEKTNTDTYKTIFPIPQFAINANPNLAPQNLGY